MKKYLLGIVFSITAASLFTGCSATDTTAKKEEVANPMVEVEGADAFNEVEADIEVPAGASNAKYYIIGDEIAEIQFEMNDATYSYRASGVTSGDISGVQGDFDDSKSSSVIVGDLEIAVLSPLDNEYGYLSQWSYEDVSYSLFTDDEVDLPVFSSLVKELARDTAPKRI